MENKHLGPMSGQERRPSSQLCYGFLFQHLLSQDRSPGLESRPHPTRIQPLRVGREERSEKALCLPLTGAPQLLAHGEACFLQGASCLSLSPHSAQSQPCYLHPEWGCHVAHPFPSTLEEKCQGEGLRDLHRPSEMKEKS